MRGRLKHEIYDNLDVLLKALPKRVTSQVKNEGRNDQLLEAILDIGRVPTARYVDTEVVLSDVDVSATEIGGVVDRIGVFDADNRAGIERTLHRISAIRNRQGEVVGLTCRVGRAVYGTIEIIQDVIESGKSTLLLGRPGVGKTTMLREAARVLAESRRVVVVDTSNEIGGDGDIPHPAVGRARRMQVKNPAYQHEVMIEAVENHNPEIIVIDEIGREQEAVAARTIAERGVQLIGTAHGNTLDNLMVNPTLADLVGGIESVTLSDDEARRRGPQKTDLERRSPPTFDLLIEILDRDRLNVHLDVSDSVDKLLRGQQIRTELRSRTQEGGYKKTNRVNERVLGRSDNKYSGSMQWNGFANDDYYEAGSRTPDYSHIQPIAVYVYGIDRGRLERATRRLHVPLRVVDEMKEAQALVTLKAHYRRRRAPISNAESMGIPIYVLRSNTQHQIEKLLVEVFGLSNKELGFRERPNGSKDEAKAAIDMIRKGAKHIDLKPQASSVRRRQHELVRRAKLVSHSYGVEPNRHVRVFKG